MQDSQDKVDSNKVKKGKAWRWVLWWQVDPDTLQTQVEGYDTLSFFRSARKLGLFCLLLSAAFTTIFIVFFNYQWSAFLDVALTCIIGFFIYKGHQWAMVVAMILWTFEKAMQLLGMAMSHSGMVIVPIIWWLAYMYIFYLAYSVEKARRKKGKAN